jgi:hypothetical protein
MDLTDQMHLLSIITSHLRNKFEEMTNDNFGDIFQTITTAVTKDFRGSYSVTITVEEDLDEDQLGDAFVSGHTFSNTIVWNSDDKGKQELGRRISFELEYFLIQKAISLQTTRLSITGYTEAYIEFPNLSVKSVVRCTYNF